MPILCHQKVLITVSVISIYSYNDIINIIIIIIPAFDSRVCVTIMTRQAEDYGRLALYEKEDLPYRRDAEMFMANYTEERKKQHARMME